jgi:hypothetical protein
VGRDGTAIPCRRKLSQLPRTPPVQRIPRVLLRLGESLSCPNSRPSAVVRCCAWPCGSRRALVRSTGLRSRIVQYQPAGLQFSFNHPECTATHRTARHSTATPSRPSTPRGVTDISRGSSEANTPGDPPPKNDLHPEGVRDRVIYETDGGFVRPIASRTTHLRRAKIPHVTTITNPRGALDRVRPAERIHGGF